MNLIDRARIEAAAASYSFWLDLRGARSKRRRELRRELRTNLLEAAERGGAAAAVHNLGGTRRIAADAMAPDHTRPRWAAGLTAAVTALVLTLWFELLAALVWVDGVRAADPGRAVTGSLFPFPGSRVEYLSVDGGLAFSFEPGWLCLLLALLTFLAVARPWRRFSASRHRTHALVV